MTEPNQAVLDESQTDKTIATVQLGGRGWPIPLLAPKQNRVVVPLVYKAAPKLFTVDRLNLSHLSVIMTPEFYSDMLDIVYTALTRAHPGLPRAEFDEMPIGTMELLGAVVTIAAQTGIFRQAKEGEQPMGEAGATSSQTGT
jgi:hypothetical protein